MLTYIAAEIYAKWIRTPNDFRSDFARKLRAFLEGLEVQHIDTLLFFGQVGDFRSLGERMAELTRDMKRSATSEQQQQKEKEYGTADRS
jgi:pyoverdine/dityrosine biosynthesis protein Dit1